MDTEFPSYGRKPCSRTCGHIIQQNEVPKFRVTFQITFLSSKVLFQVLEGEEIEIQTSPWHAIVLSKFPSCEDRLGDQICTGILIGDQWLLTAAHCTTFLSNECIPDAFPVTIPLYPENVTVRVGIGSSKHKLVGVEHIYWNNLYDVQKRHHVSQYDVVLLKVYLLRV